EQAVMVNLYRVTQSLLAGRISEKTAGLTLWSIAIGGPAATRISPQRTRRAQRKNENRLPQIHGKPGLVNADGRRSERKFSRESRHPRQAGAGAGTRLTRTNTNQHESDSGVTSDKSFVFGVTLGSTPANRRDRRH